MTDPVPLLDSSTDDFERALLGSAARDIGSPGARARCIAAVGPAVALLATSQTGSAAVLLSVLKAVGVGLALGAAVSGGAYVAMNDARDAKVIVTPTAPRRAASLPSKAAPRGETARPLAPAIEPVTVASPRLVSSPSVPPSPQAAPPDVPLDRSLEQEVSALDAARQALTAGDAQRALSAIERYSHEFPRGALGPEAVYLKVRALLATGQRARAAAVGQSFLRTHPRAAGKLAQLLEQENLR